MWDWLKRNAEPIEAAGMLLTGIIAGIAALVAYMQITAQWELEHQKSARESLRAFQTLSLNHPHLANPDLRALTAAEKEQYGWYIGQMTTTFEEVLSFFPDAADWKPMMTGQIQLHCGYFQSTWFNPDHYSDAMIKLVTSSLAETADLCRGPLDD